MPAKIFADEWRAVAVAVVPLALAAANVSLNIAARRVAQKDASVIEKLVSAEFLLAFAVGCVSLTLLILLYSLPDMNVARGVVIAGTASICVGTVVGVAMGGKLTPTEGCLWLLLVAFYIARWWQAR